MLMSPAEPDVGPNDDPNPNNDASSNGDSNPNSPTSFTHIDSASRDGAGGSPSNENPVQTSLIPLWLSPTLIPWSILWILLLKAMIPKLGLLLWNLIAKSVVSLIICYHNWWVIYDVTLDPGSYL